MKVRCAQKLTWPTKNFNARLAGQVLKADMGYHDPGLRLKKEQEDFIREEGRVNLVPKEKKIHGKTNFSRQILENKIFPIANLPARRILKKQIEQVAEENDSFSPNIGLP